MYGGGELAKVEGNTSVTLLEGILKGHLYGAGKGMTAVEMQDDDVKADITAAIKAALTEEKLASYKETKRAEIIASRGDAIRSAIVAAKRAEIVAAKHDEYFEQLQNDPDNAGKTVAEIEALVNAAIDAEMETDSIKEEIARAYEAALDAAVMEALELEGVVATIEAEVKSEVTDDVVKAGTLAVASVGGTTDVTVGKEKADYAHGIDYSLIAPVVDGKITGVAAPHSKGTDAEGKEVDVVTRGTAIVLGNIYGGGEMAQVLGQVDDANTRLVTSALEELLEDISVAVPTAFLKDDIRGRKKTLDVKLYGGAEIYGKVFGGGKGCENYDLADAASVTGQTRVLLDGARAWSALYGGAAEATVHGNTLVHLLRGVAGHDIVGGGLGNLRSQSAKDAITASVLDEEKNFSNADIKKVDKLYKKDGTEISLEEGLTGNSFVIVGDGNTVVPDELTINLAYSLKEDTDTDGRVINDKVYTGNDVEDFAQNCDPSVSPFGTDKPYYKIQFTPGVIKFDINHNIYGGGMTASVVGNNTNIHIARGMLRNEDLYCDVPAVMNQYGQNPWQTNWENLASPYFGIFGGGFGKPSHVKGDTHVTVAIDPAGISTSDLATHITDIQKDDYSEDNDREAGKLYGRNARTYCDVLGGGFNGDVLGSTHVKVGYNTYLRKVYGGGLYSPVGATEVFVKNGVIDYVFGGGMIGDVRNTARMAIGTRDITRADASVEQTPFEATHTADVRNSSLADMTPYEPNAGRAELMNKYLLIRKGIYGGNDVAGTVGIIESTDDPSHKQKVTVKTYALEQITKIYDSHEKAVLGRNDFSKSDSTDYNYTIYQTDASGPREYFEVPVRIQELSRENGTKVYARVEVSNKNQKYNGKYTDADGNKCDIPIDSPVPDSEVDLGDLPGLADPLEGVNLAIFGGTVLGDVYGAGNGAHTGYSDPNNCLFTDSDPSNDTYYLRPLYGKYVGNVLNVKNAEGTWVDVETLDHDARIAAAEAYPTWGAAEAYPTWGKVYKSRPRTAHVEMYVYGNSLADRVNIKGKTFGGGNSCNVGQWHTQMSGIHDVDKPELYIGGGKLTMNIGSHVILGKDPTEADKANTINGLFMGCNGEKLATQPENMEDAKYYHRYFQGIIDKDNSSDNYTIGTSTGKRIVATTEDDYEGTIAYWPGFMLYGDNVSNQQIALEAYLKNIEMDADVKLNIPKTATDITMSSFVGGGFRGSMSASNANRTPYNYTLPAGVTVRDRIIGGCYNAFVKYYEYHVAGKVTNEDTYQDQKIEKDYLTYYLIPDPNNPGQLAYQKTGLVQTSVFGGFTGGVVGNVNKGMGTTSHTDRSFARLKGLDPRAEDTRDSDDPTKGVNHFQDAYIQLHLYNKVLPHVEYTLNTEKPIYSEPQHKRDKDGNSLYYGTTIDAEGNEIADTSVETTTYSPFPVMTEPEFLGYAHENTRAWGGNVYGGCYNSGFVHGDIVVDYHCNIDEEAFQNMYSGDELIDEYGQQYFTTYSPGTYELAADLDNNDCLRVYGAGYGEQTEVYGDAFVIVHAVDDESYDINKSTPHVFNVFGGSEKGTLVGDTYLFYDGGMSLGLGGKEKTEGTIFGNMYGGGMQGDLVKDYKIHQGTIYDNYMRDAYAVESGSSFVEAIGGKVHGIYGGARQANMEGGAIVWCHEPASAPDPETHIGLMAGIVCGGTDVAGAITGQAQNYRAVEKIGGVDNLGFYKDKDPVLIDQLKKEREIAENHGTDWRSRPSTWVRIGGDKSILERASDMNKKKVDDAASASPSFHRGYPLIGTVYAGGNGEMYNDYKTNHGTLPDPLPAPDVDYAVLDITGGTMARAFGGANMATIKRHTYINVENAFTPHVNDNTLSRQENMADVNDPRAKKDYIAKFNVGTDADFQTKLRFIREQFLGIYAHEVKPLGNGDYTLNYQTLRLFGGNNESDMAIQPSWNMISGHLGSVYSGGNRGRMTYYNPGKLNDCTEATWNSQTHGPDETWEDFHANYFETRGICLTVNSPNIYIDEIYGGCRMSDVMAAQVQLRNDADTEDMTADASKAIYEAKNLLNHTTLDNRGSYNAATDAHGTMTQLTDDNGNVILANFFELYPIVTDDNSPRELYDQDFYGATLKILDGHFNSVYGGNDVAGNIYNGSRLFVAGAISGDIYGAGNGNYFYQYADDDLISDEIKEKYATGTDAGGNKYIDRIVELYDEDLWNPKTATGHGNAYFILPKMPDTHVYHSMPTTGATDLQKIVAINSMRPNVAKAYLDIEGRPGTSETVYVTGSVYCGGNSSTITRMTFNTEQPVPTTRFNMGDNVTLNNVFMGSNGENMRNSNYLEGMERLNNIDLTAETKLDADEKVGGVALSIDDKILAGYNTEGEKMPTQYGKTFTENVYPHLIDVFMRGVEMDALPVGFNNMASLTNEYTKAFVGDFCLGGNAGSMMVGKKVSMTLPYSLKIFGNVIGGCKDTNFSYRGVKHVGGFLMPLNDFAKDDNGHLLNMKNRPYMVDGNSIFTYQETGKTLAEIREQIALFYEGKYKDSTLVLMPNTTKIELNIQSQFINRFMDVTAQNTPSGDLFLVNNQYFATDPGVRDATFERVTDTYGRLYYENYTDAIRTAELQSSWLGEGCNIYGGCYQSGTVVGDVHIDVYSDMFAKVARAKDFEEKDDDPAHNLTYSFDWENTKIGGENSGLGFKDMLERTADKNKNHEMSAFGVYGGGFGADTRVLGDTHVHTRHYSDGKHDEEHPSMTNIFGGGRSGVVVGNSDIRVQDGYITGDVVGGSDASTFYGSTQIMVGYPKHYVAKKTGKYHLKRGDRWNLDRTKTIVKNNVPSDVPVINQDVFYREGDIIPANVAEQIVGLYEYDGVNTDGTIKYKDFKDLEHEPRFLNEDGTFSDAAVHNAENAYFKIIDEVAKPTEEHGMFPGAWDSDTDGDGKNERLVDIRILGGVYGGGYTVASSLNTTAGTYTVLKYDDVDTEAVGYVEQSILNTASNLAYTKNISQTSGDTFNKEFGGNATIIVTDDTNPTNNTRRDHIRISHIVANEKTLKKGENHLSYFKVAKDAVGNTITDGFGNTLYETLTNYEITEDDVTAGKNTVIELSGDGGIFGDGHLVYCEGFRVADVTGYGYDETCIAYPALLNTFQRLDLVTITDCCFMLQGQRDFATTKPDKTIYSVTRVDEWRMNSRLLPVEGNVIPVTGKRTDANPQGNTAEFYTPGVRNYVGFYNNVHFLGCMVSNDLFNAGFRDANGEYHKTNEFKYGDSFTDSDNYYNIEAGKSETPDKSLSYFNEKMMYIQKYYDAYKMPNTEVAALPDDQKAKVEADRLSFQQRNVGTARNLIGVNNGYTLRIQNEQKPTYEQYTPKNGTEKVSKTTANTFYYGPIVGVMEVKLLTAVQGEGGGYVYADNIHAEKVDAQGVVKEDPTDMNEHDNAHFMNRSGNFVFPGVMNVGGENPQYVVDNCYPTHFEDSHAKHADEAHNTEDNSADIECHYWYLDGYNYFYNAVLTGYTYNGTGTFRLNQEEQALLFNGVDDGLPVYLKSLVWKDEGVHLDDEGNALQVTDKDGNTDSYTSDIEGMHTPLTDGNGVAFDGNPYDFHLYLGTYPILGQESSYTGWQRDMENPGLTSDNNWGPYSDKDSDGGITGSDGEKYVERLYNTWQEGGETKHKKGEMPVLGIQLYDPVDNNPKDDPRYFQNHMEQPIKVQMVFVMPARDLGNGEIIPEHTYTVNLTIVYVQGPRIDGFPKITNCALPGEMVTATSEGIEITADEGMPVTPGSLKWMLRPLKDRTDFTKGWEDAATYEIPAIFSKTDLTGSVYTATYPALHYQDKWDFAFQFMAGGNEFDVYTSQDTEATYHYEMVHNYHSMKRVWDMMGVVPLAGSTKDFDLKPIAGSRIYIEDTEDLLWFMKYVKTLQYTDRKYVVADGLKDDDTRIGKQYEGMLLDGAPIHFGYGHPRYAKGLEFYLMTDVDLTTADATTSINSILGNDFNWDDALAQFAGQFHGMGHTITLPAGKQFSLAGAHVNYLQLLHKGDVASRQQKYGQEAYESNFDYLDERYHLGADMEKVRETSTTSAEGSFYVEDYFHNGDYRYATFKITDDDFDEAKYVDGAHLRSQQRPNYGSDESHHHYYADLDAHTVYHAPDLLRVDTYQDSEGKTVYHDTYHPLFNHVVAATVKDMDDKDVDVTYLDLAENDIVNDYIFFGQDLSKDKDHSVIAEVKNMPRSILRSDYLYGGTYGDKGIAPLGEPRIHRASGFRHTKFDEGFYFNEEAYVGDDYLTAVSFMPYGEYAEDYPTTAPSGSTMPAGYKGVYYAPQLDMPGLGLKGYAQNDRLTKNFLVYTPIGDDANYTPVPITNANEVAPAYTHYLEGMNNSFSLTAGLNYENNKPESEIIGHHIKGTTSNASIDYLHLVDKQDFNAPYAFDVTKRAWYERMPDRWRNADDYNGASAWEGIVLPFTAKTVTASENKEISHFYGTDITNANHPNANDHTLHHEYWLNGLVEVSDGSDPETKTALMARPSTSGTGLFVDSRQSGDSYTYPANTYFTGLTNYTDYHDNDYTDDDTDDDTDEDEWMRTDAEWYKSSHTFADYVYLSKTVPYLIAFPGNDFYEFSMEGTVYDRNKHEKDKTKPQLVTFENTNNPTIAVSDDEAGERTSVANEYKHVGTYMKLVSDASAETPSKLGSGIAIDADGRRFAKYNSEDVKTFNYVLPFRTYMVAPLTSPAPQTRAILINSYGEDPIEEEDPEDELQEDYFSIYGYDGDLIVESSQNMKLQVYTAAGQLVRVINVKPGRNIYHGFQSGIYLVGGKKVAL